MIDAKLLKRYKIKSPLALVVGALFLIAGLGMAFELWFFLINAEKTIGRVTEVQTEKVKCGRRGRSSCLESTARIEYMVGTQKQVVILEEVFSRGKSVFAAGQQLPLLYNRYKPNDARRDLGDGIWTKPKTFLGLSLLSVPLAFLPGRRYR
jgi:Protein of unknown function (DUF3592)